MSTIRKYIMKHFINVELHGKRYVLYDNVNHNIVITRYIDEIGLKVLNLMLMQYDGYIIVDDKDYGIETNLSCISSVFKSGPLDGDDVYYKESNSCILIKFSAGLNYLEVVVLLVHIVFHQFLLEDLMNFYLLNIVEMG